MPAVVANRAGIKTEDVAQFAGLWWRADGPNGEVLAFDNMAQTGPRGTSDWARFSIDLDIPKEAVNINFGVLMPGKGKAWFDGLEVLLDGAEYQDPKRFDFDFESERVIGFMVFPFRNYRTRLDGQIAKSGKRSLRLESMGDAGSDDSAAQDVEIARKVLKKLEDAQEELSRTTEKAEVAWAIQNARVVAQCMEMRAAQAGNVRDRCMAENVAWILRQNPRAKIVLWAHNAHIAKQNGAMGQHLAEKFGDDYLAFAFATAKGEYQAIGGKDGLSAHRLQEPPPGSAEDIFRRTAVARFVLDLRKASEHSPESGWLAKPLLFRLIGALAMDDQFQAQNLKKGFDGIIYIEETFRARPF